MADELKKTNETGETDAADEVIRRIRTAKGQRPHFFPDPNVDKLLAMLMAVVAELAVVRERLDTHERLADQDQLPSHAKVEDFKANDQVAEQRTQWRGDYISRVMRVITSELDQLKDN